MMNKISRTQGPRFQSFYCTEEKKSELDNHAVQWNLNITKTLTIKIVLLYEISHYIRVKKIEI